MVPPRLEFVPEAEYPFGARANGIEGAVRLELLVSETGTVSDILAVRGPEVLRSSSVDAARRMRFSPALLNGVPIPVQIPYT
ncbi:MAG: energy transducer TonB, partial [Myxococcota bacterium]